MVAYSALVKQFGKRGTDAGGQQRGGYSTSIAIAIAVAILLHHGYALAKLMREPI